MIPCLILLFVCTMVYVVCGSPKKEGSGLWDPQVATRAGTAAPLPGRLNLRGEGGSNYQTVGASVMCAIFS